MKGLIDDVKVWRINPRRVDAEFLGRPVDEHVKQCLANWSRAVSEVLRADPQCARQLGELLNRAVASIIRDGLNHSDATRTRFEKTAEEYRSCGRTAISATLCRSSGRSRFLRAAAGRLDPAHTPTSPRCSRLAA